MNDAEFQEFQQRQAERMKPVIDALNPFQRVMLELDVALTGNSPAKVASQIHHYPKSLEDWISEPGGNPLWYLSDGGYSRVVWITRTGKMSLTYNSTPPVVARWEQAAPQVKAAEDFCNAEYKRLLGQPVNEAKNLRAELERALDVLRRRNPMGYAQVLLMPFGPFPPETTDDPNHPWWSSEAAASLLQSFKEGAHEGVKPGGNPQRRLAPSRQWPPHRPEQEPPGVRGRWTEAKANGIKAADLMFQPKRAVIRYIPIESRGELAWYWTLNPFPNGDALADGSAKSRGQASTQARQKARKLGWKVFHVEIVRAPAAPARSPGAKGIVEDALDDDEEDNLRAKDPRPNVVIMKDVLQRALSKVTEYDFELEPNQNETVLSLKADNGLTVLFRIGAENSSGFFFNMLALKEIAEQPGKANSILSDKDSIIYGMKLDWAAQKVAAFIDRAVRSAVKNEPEPKYSKEEEEEGLRRIALLLLGKDPTVPEPEPLPVAQQIDTLMRQIAAEPDPLKKETLKKEALRLMAQESGRRLVATLLENEDDESEDFDPRAEVRRITGPIDTTDLIATLRQKIDSDATIDYAEQASSGGPVNYRVSLEAHKYRVNPGDPQKHAVNISKRDIENIAVVARRWFVDNGYYVLNVIPARHEDDNFYYFEFSAISKAAKDMEQHFRKRLGETEEEDFDPKSEVMRMVDPEFPANKVTYEGTPERYKMYFIGQWLGTVFVEGSTMPRNIMATFKIDPEKLGPFGCYREAEQALWEKWVAHVRSTRGDEAADRLRYMSMKESEDEDFDPKREILRLDRKFDYATNLTDDIHKAFDIRGAGLTVTETDPVCTLSMWSYWNPEEPDRAKFLDALTRFVSNWIQERGHRVMRIERSTSKDPYKAAPMWYVGIVYFLHEEAIKHLAGKLGSDVTAQFTTP